MNTSSDSLPRVPFRVLFVCLGNICRSPAAETVFKSQTTARGWDKLVVSDSAGTLGYHIGTSPDPRMRASLAAHGYADYGLHARQVTRADVGRFDLVLAMDRENFRDLQALGFDAPTHLRMMGDFTHDRAGRDVPDPYYGDRSGFDRVVEMLEDACTGLLDEIAGHLGK